MDGESGALPARGDPDIRRWRDGRHGMMAIPVTKRVRAERTRTQILQAAERRFATLGFADTRLEDVGEDAGVGRSAVLYHFRDKRQLYEAVLDAVFGGFLEVIQPALTGTGTLPARIEASVAASIDWVARRPTAAYIALREAASTDPEFRQRVRRRTIPLLRLVTRIFEEGRHTGALRPTSADALHFSSAIVGATMFYIAALPAFGGDLPYDPLAPEQIDAHKRDVIQIARRLLGIDSPRRLQPAPRRAARGRK